MPRGRQAPAVDGADARVGQAGGGSPASGRPSESSIGSGESGEIKVTFVAKFCYYTVGFLAYWFGASRFDMDGDGDFDAADVQQMMNSGGKHLHLNFSRPPQNKQAQKARKKAREEKKKREEKEAAQREKMHQDALRHNEERGGLSGAMGNVGEHLAHSVDRAADKMGKLGEADVEDGDAEAEVMENLRQHWPWFTIIEVLLILVLWAVFAGLNYPYVRNTLHVRVEDSMVLKDFTKEGTLYQANCAQECDAEDACVGYAFREGPFSECRLLSTLPATDNSGTITEQCSDRTWNWLTYSKGSWDLSVWMSMQGGLENWFPGLTALESKHFCAEGFHLSFLYRWWTYQFTHGGISHVGSNSFMTIILGIPLEGMHGTGMFSLMWTTGVLGGAFNWALFDPYRKTFGASGGCFSLLGMHVADLVMNWKQKKFRWMMVLMLLMVTAVELAGFWANHSEEGSLTAHCAHVGGLIAGLLIGVCVGRNIHAERWERTVQVFCWLTGIGLCVVSAIWWFAANPFPGIRNAWDLTERPWCWIGQACIGDNGDPCPWTRVLSGSTEYLNQCVFCDTRACVEGWFSAKDESDRFKFCPRSFGWSACHDHFDDSWDLFYPPAKSMFQ